MTLYLVRHGVTVWGEGGRIQGQSDAPLSERGREQARAAARRLKSLSPFDALYSSDLGRAAATAEEISKALGLPLAFDSRLREIDFGKFEGLEMEEAERLYPEEFKAWREDPVHNRPPGGERLEALLSRVSNFVEELRERHPKGRVIAVSHGGPIRAMVLLALGLDLESSWRRVYVWWGSITAIEFPPSGPPLLRLFNDTCHLEEERGVFAPHGPMGGGHRLRRGHNP